MDTVTIKVPKWMLDMIDLLVKKDLFPSRSEFIREAIRIHLQTKKKELRTHYVYTT